MKTTVEISDPLFRQVKRYAAAHDLTFRQAVESGLRKLVEPAPNRQKPFRLRDCAFKGGRGMVKDYTWPEIRAIIYEGHGE